MKCPKCGSIEYHKMVGQNVCVSCITTWTDWQQSRIEELESAIESNEEVFLRKLRNAVKFAPLALKQLETIKELKAKIEELEAAEKEYAEKYGMVMSEQCPTDEKHCACVPYLRKGIKELEARLVDAGALHLADEQSVKNLEARLKDAEEIMRNHYGPMCHNWNGQTTVVTCDDMRLSFPCLHCAIDAYFKRHGR